MPDNSEDLLVEQEAARLLRWSVANMRKRRLLGLPPAWVKIGASVRYQRKALEEFIHNGQQPVRELELLRVLQDGGKSQSARQQGKGGR